MTWVRLDETFAKHPKVVAAGPLGLAMHVTAICYCNQYLTDGFVLKRVPAGLLNLDDIDVNLDGDGYENAGWRLIVDCLVDVGLWEPVTGGWLIHDYHDYQPSKAEVLELREARAEAGRKGGLAKALANAKASAKQTSSNGSSKTLAKSYPVPVPVSSRSRALNLDLDQEQGHGPGDNSHKFTPPTLKDMP